MERDGVLAHTREKNEAIARSAYPRNGIIGISGNDEEPRLGHMKRLLEPSQWCPETILVYITETVASRKLVFIQSCRAFS